MGNSAVLKKKVIAFLLKRTQPCVLALVAFTWDTILQFLLFILLISTIRLLKALGKKTI